MGTGQEVSLDEGRLIGGLPSLHGLKSLLLYSRPGSRATQEWIKKAPHLGVRVTKELRSTMLANFI